MELLEFGHGGARVIAFPTSKGRFFEWEDRGMPRCPRCSTTAGCTSPAWTRSITSWYAYHTHPGARAWRHEQYTSYIVNEVLPWTRWRSGHPFTILTGASFGAFHALSIGLRHPDKFNRVLSMSGLADIRGFLGGYHNETVYFQNPMDFIDHASGWHLDCLRRQEIILAVGNGDKLLHQNRELSGKLWAKGVGNALRGWDGFAHDWDVWHKMVQMYIGGHD